MDFLELAQNRYSVRSFSSTPVPSDLVEKILRAAQLAPTACDYQPVKVLVLTRKDALERFRRCTECHFEAPLAFIVCADKTTCWKRRYDGKESGDIDASIVATHMMLEASSLGVGSTWVMYFIPEAVRQEFELPENLEPVALLPMGFPSESAAPSPRHTERKPLSELVTML